MIQKVLITGGTGFIGSHIADHLVKNYEVISLSRSDSQNWRLEHGEAIRSIYADLTNPEKLRETLGSIEPDAVIHTAGSTQTSRDLTVLDDVLKTNFLGTKNLLSVLVDLDCHLFINFGSADEYGTRESPNKESHREDSISPYSLSKICTTQMSNLYARLTDIQAFTVRPFLVYGPKQPPEMLIPSLIDAGLQGEAMDLSPGNQERDPVFVLDIPEIIESLIRNRDQIKNHEIINIGRGRPIKVKEIAEITSKLLPQLEVDHGERSYRENENMSLVASTDKLRNYTQKVPETPPEDGIKATITWIKNNSQKR